jgi:ligand-binding sensor domain-containing protein
LPDNPKAEKIQVLYQDRKKQIWVGTSDGLYKLIETDESAAFEPVALGNLLPVAFLVQEELILLISRFKSVTVSTPSA